MSRTRNEFSWPHQVKGDVVRTRFGLRREPETKKSKARAPEQEASTFSYGSPGRGANGESSN